MKFPHAYKGVKLIFIAEIMSIIAAIVALIAALIATLVTSGRSGLAASSATLLLVSGIASIVVFVVQLVGLFKGAKESRDFRIALWIVLVGIAASITSAILQSIESTKGLSPILFAVLDTISTLADFLVVICVLFGIADLANRLGDNEMDEKGHRLAFYFIIIYLVVLIFCLLPGFGGYIVNPGWRLVFSIFTIAAAALEIFIYVSFVIYLARATRMLEQ